MRPALPPLPPVRGRLRRDVLMAECCRFRVGGSADVVFAPADVEDLSRFLRNLPPEVPLHVLGAGSNVLVRDGGVRGVVVKQGRAFGAIREESPAVLRVGAALPLALLMRAAARASLSGLEFYQGIPGTVGGAVAMNAGADGRDTRDVLKSVEVMDRRGVRHRFTVDEMSMTYRGNERVRDMIVVEAEFHTSPGDRERIGSRMRDIRERRLAAQPDDPRTCGSAFMNPNGAKAWTFIDAAGCRGLRVGGARVSERHCNFLVNDGRASAEDLENLGETVRTRVRATSGIDLRWEIRRLGSAHGRARSAVVPEERDPKDRTSERHELLGAAR